MKKMKCEVSGNPNISNVNCPLPLSVIPNNMGINLCSVKDIEWTEREDG